MDTSKGKPDWDMNKGPKADNTPVGSAGQPNNAQGDNNPRSDAIRRRMDKKKAMDRGKK